MAVSFVSSFHRCPSVSCQGGVNHVHQLRPISTGHVRQFSVDKRNRTGRSASQCELVIRARSSQSRQAPTQSVTKFSKQDAESVRKSLQTLTEVRTLLERNLLYNLLYNTCDLGSIAPPQSLPAAYDAQLRPT